MTKTEVESNERSGTRKTTDLIVQPNCYFYKLVYSFSQIQICDHSEQENTLHKRYTLIYI